MPNASGREAEDQLLRNRNYQAAREWALEKMSSDDIETYNALVSDPSTKGAGADFLYGRWMEARREAESPQIIPQPPEPRNPDLYYSQADLAAAMKDPRYQTESRFREEVAFKVFQSRQAGTLEGTGRHYSQGVQTISSMGDRMPGWHEQQKRDMDADQAAARVARLEEQAEQARQDALRAEQKRNSLPWS